jgi:hypothetical protein
LVAWSAWFQPFAFKCNLCRYNTGGAAAAAKLGMSHPDQFRPSVDTGGGDDDDNAKGEKNTALLALEAPPTEELDASERG